MYSLKIVASQEYKLHDDQLEMLEKTLSNKQHKEGKFTRTALYKFRNKVKTTDIGTNTN